MFGKKITEAEAKVEIQDAGMRRQLFEVLWQGRTDAKGEDPRPCPSLNDEEVKEELQRVLGYKKG